MCPERLLAVALQAAEEVPQVMSVMSWQEHARRSLYRMHFACPHACTHSLVAAPLVESEVMLRLNCRWCNGSAWVAWRPIVDQGADPDDFITYVEGLVNGQAEPAPQE